MPGQASPTLVTAQMAAIKTMKHMLSQWQHISESSHQLQLFFQKITHCFTSLLCTAARLCCIMQHKSWSTCVVNINLVGVLLAFCLFLQGVPCQHALAMQQLAQICVNEML